MRVFEDEVYKTITTKQESVYYVMVLGYLGRVIPDSVSVYAGSRGSANQATFSNVC